MNSSLKKRKKENIYKTVGACEKRGYLLSFINERQYADIISYIITSLHFFYTSTVWKVSKYGIFSGPYLEAFHAVFNLEVKSISVKEFSKKERVSVANT